MLPYQANSLFCMMWNVQAVRVSICSVSDKHLATAG